MALYRFVSRRSFTSLSRLWCYRSIYGCAPSIAVSSPCRSVSSGSNWIRSPLFSQHCSNRLVHTSQQDSDSTFSSTASPGDAENNGVKFLEKLVCNMRETLARVHPGTDESVINGLVDDIVGNIVKHIEKVGLEEFVRAEGTMPTPEAYSEDDWRIVSEVTKGVLHSLTASPGDAENDGVKFLGKLERVMRKTLAHVFAGTDEIIIAEMVDDIVGNIVKHIEKVGLEEFIRAEGTMPTSEEYSEDVWRIVSEVNKLVFLSSTASPGDAENDDLTNFLNPFLEKVVWNMRKTLTQAYRGTDKIIIDDMLGEIVLNIRKHIKKVGLEKFIRAEGMMPASEEYPEELYRIVSEVNKMVLQDTEKEWMKEMRKTFLYSEKVKEMCRFAGEIGIRGDMLREFRFKWAHEEMEESLNYKALEFQIARYEFLKENKVTDELQDIERVIMETLEEQKEEDRKTAVSLPKRHGNINYKIYGLNLSDPKWTVVAEKIHESGKVLWPQEPKPITGKCKLVTDEILSLKEEDDPTSLLGEWMELQQPSRTEWIAFQDILKKQNPHQYLKITEHLLVEESFKANIHDYSRLIDDYAKSNRFEDAERVLNKMNEHGIVPDAMTLTIVIDMFCKAGNLRKAKEVFENLRTCGFEPDMKVYSSMIMASVNAGDPSQGESLMREMETRDMKPTEEIYMALLRSYAKLGDAKGAQRISMTMQFAGFQQNLESFTLMVEAFVEANDSVQAKANFDQMIKSGLKPDDRCVAAVVAGYEQNNELDAALKLLLELEKDGFVPGVATYTNMVDWLAKMELIDEAEQIIDQIAELREPPPLKLHLSMCDMYSKAGFEKKVVKAVGVLESKSDELSQKEFERIIKSLTAGGFTQDAQKFKALMEARGYTPSENLRMDMLASQALNKGPVRMGSRFTRG